jgi:hypothetical protein
MDIIILSHKIDKNLPNRTTEPDVIFLMIILLLQLSITHFTFSAVFITLPMKSIKSFFCTKLEFFFSIEFAILFCLFFVWILLLFFKFKFNFIRYVV